MIGVLITVFGTLKSLRLDRATFRWFDSLLSSRAHQAQKKLLKVNCDLLMILLPTKVFISFH